ncbi:MAG: T9SS type A sorting domain-containing protein [Chitinophagales bacterium]
MDFVPNPTANLTNLLITSNVSQEVRVELYNLIGERMLDRNVLLNKGGNNVPFNLNALASGTYTALVHTGNEVHTRKVLVQSNPPCSLLAKAALYAAFFMFYWAC